MLKQFASIIFITTLIPALGFSQVKGGKQDKLMDLYVMEKYEECAFKAEKITLNKETSSDPEAYLYLSMCYLYIYKHMDEFENPDDVYKNALKDAISNASKALKKDKKQELIPQNEDFYAELKEAGLNEINIFVNDDNFKKAASAMKQLSKIDPEDENLTFALGVLQILSANAVEGERILEEAFKSMDTKYADASYESDEVSMPMMVKLFIVYTNNLVKNGDTAKAKSIIEKAKGYLAANQEILDQYNKLNG